MPQSWIRKVLKSTSESESPEKFFYWSALATLSAIVQKNVFLDRFLYKLYPNIYVLIVGPSGVRKGVPVALAKSLVDYIKCTKVIHGRSSIQGVVKGLAQTLQLSDGTILKEAHGFIHSGEFSAFLVKDPDALTILTDLYDTQWNEDWKSTLKHSPVDSLKDVCVTLLGASNEEHLKDIIPPNAIGGGFIARTFLVHSDQKRGSNPLTEKPKLLISIPDLCTYLFKVASVKGEFRWSEKGKKLYEDWYSEYDKKNKNDSTGTAERIGDSLLKAAMLISLSKNTELALEEDDIQEALDESFDCMTDMKKVILGIGGKSEYAERAGMVMKALLAKENHEMSRQKILIKLWGDVDSLDLDRIIENAVEAKAIEPERRGNQIFYKLTKVALDMYSKIEGR